MKILEKTARFAAVAFAVLFIVLSLVGIFGAWFVNRKASDVALKGFGVIEMGVGVVDAGVGRVDDFIGISRTEVQEAAETISGVGAQAVSNSPVLNALNERLSSLPMMAERAPRLATLDETFDRLEEMSANGTQLRSTLRALVAEQKSEIAPETIATLKGLTQRIDTRLSEVQANVQSVRAEVDALQGRLDKRKSRLLFAFNLVALLSTLMLAWIVYTQVVVIQHHWARMREK
ncbi:MAG: hypothetical protein DME42_08890 [Verrucomicrobia bacterium]|nr:MAG: hypothetical protein DME42_08890 [Verrucomicrobiota bacterium]